MPIRIDYSPVNSLMNLARSAGEAQGGRENAARDLAFTQMALQAQTDNAQIAATQQRNDQAFQLQRAALARTSRTATSRSQGKSPLAGEFDRVLQRQALSRTWDQGDQAAQIEQLGAIPGLTDRERESIKLGIMGGQSLTTLLKERPEQRTGLTPGQRVSGAKTLWLQQRDDLEAERKSLYEELGYEGKTRDASWQQRMDAVTKQIAAHDVSYTRDIMGEGAPSAQTATFNTPQKLPQTKAEAVVGQIYVDARGGLWRWTGQDMAKVQQSGAVNLIAPSTPAEQETNRPFKSQPSGSDIRQWGKRPPGLGR